MLYVYYSTNSKIDKEQSDHYIKNNKGKVVEDPQIISAAILNPMARLTLIIGEEDAEIINIISVSKLKRSIVLITRSMSLANILCNKVVSSYIVDDTTEFMPDLWENPVLNYKNVEFLKSIGKRPVYYEFNLKSDAIMCSAMYSVETINGEKVQYISFRNMTKKESMSAFKKEYSQGKRFLKQNNQKQSKEDKQLYSELKKDPGKSIRVYKDILDYILYNKYATEDQVQRAQDFIKTPTQLNTRIEQALCYQGVFSREDLVDILRHYLNAQVIGKRELEDFVVNYKNVGEKLKQQGVVEAYYKDDKDFKQTIIILPYTLKDSLMETINKTISYDRVLLTLPEYLEE